MRIRLLGDAGADEVRVLSFDADAAAMSAPEFVERYLRGDLSAVQVVVGTNFRFGHRAAGDVELLRELGGGGGFGVTPVGLHADGDGIWSSSRIRALVAQGDVAAAAHGLTRPHRVEGVVVHGDHRGRELGYPTANLDMPADRARPADGVYSGWLIDDPYGPQPTRWPAAISVGANTTFGGDAPRVEAYALDRDDLDLYGHVMAVDFAERLRDMRAFPGVDDLLAAMAEDVARTRLSTAGPAVGRTG
jgi:riboflavin kinase/FMN adenylyltransferase